MKARLLFALVLMGFTSLFVQTLLIREFLISFYGNELIIGLILANWIILEAIGSLSSSRLSLKIRQPLLAYALLQTAIALYLPLGIFLIRIAKNIIGLSPGEGIGILAVSLSSFFILAPLSIFDGAQFPFGCRMLSDYSQRPIESAGRVYILEAMGFILAGPIFTYLFITKLNSFQIAFLIALVNLLSGILLLRVSGNNPVKKILSLVMAVSLALTLFLLLGFSAKIHSLSINKQWRGQQVLDYRNSVYGNLVVSKTGRQYTFYSDGIPLITTPVPDIASIEELVHFTLLSHKNPKKMLLLSGGPGGVIQEILKHPLDTLDYAELDPLLISLVKQFPSQLTQQELNDPRLNIRYTDGRRFVRQAGGRYDIIMVNLPAPSTLQLNRFFTKEFFQNIKSILNEDGIFALRLPGSLSYINSELRNLNGTLLNTLNGEFEYVKTIPADLNLFLASQTDFEITPQIIVSRMQARGIKTYLLTSSYLDYRLQPRLLEWFKKSLGDTSRIRKNLDLTPSAVFYSISYWNALFSPKLENLYRLLDRLNFKFIILALLLVGCAVFIFQRTSSKPRRISAGFAIATTGFTGMSVNLIIIFTYQSFYGFVFHHLALLITAFMAGLSLGAWLMTASLAKIKQEMRLFFKIEVATVGFCLGLAPLLIYLNRFPAAGLWFIFFLLSGLSGFLVGLEFPLANKIYGQESQGNSPSAGILYALDLSGAWAANLLVSIALVPVIGIINTCALLFLLKAISATLIKLSPEKPDPIRQPASSAGTP